MPPAFLLSGVGTALGPTAFGWTLHGGAVLLTLAGCVMVIKAYRYPDVLEDDRG